jgi:hypothetical protein
MGIMPPAVMRVHVVNEGRRVVGLWLPLFLLWPLLLVLLVIILPLALLAEAILLSAGTGIRPASLTLAITEVLGSLKGLSVDIKQPEKKTSVIVHM